MRALDVRRERRLTTLDDPAEDLEADDASAEARCAPHDDPHLSPADRPTWPVPAPRESGVRLKPTRVPWASATVDVVTADLRRDPRSESYHGDDDA